MSTLASMWKGFRAVLELESEVARLTRKLAEVDDRERETRERLVFLEGLVAGARARTAAPKRLPKQ